jgi:hypothetical protein
MSQLGWIDFSPDDRNKVSNVLALLSEPGTLDELGIGQVRDAYSNALFPGISTIQTRAKYFITVPRIMRDYQDLPAARKHRYKGLQNYLKDREDEVARVLANAHQEDPEEVTGIIGRTRIDSGGVDRRPSVIYWNGLRSFGILNTSLSLADYCRQLDREGSHSDEKTAELDEGSDDPDVIKNANLVRLPDRNQNWMSADVLHLNLSNREATFLKEKLITTPGVAYTVLAQLFKHGMTEKALEIDGQGKVTSFELLTELLVKSHKVDQRCVHAIQLANEFSLAMEGPHIRYNVLLAKINGFDNRLQKLEDEYSQWKDKVGKMNLFQADCAERWLGGDNIAFMHLKKSRASEFVRNISTMMQNGASSETLDNRVQKQALDNKGSRSLLRKKLNKEVWVGIRRLDYRWGTAKTILQDIQKGLHAGAEK